MTNTNTTDDARIQAWHALLALRATWSATRLQGGPRNRALEKRTAAAAAAWTALEPSGAPMLLLEGGSLLVCGDMGTLDAEGIDFWSTFPKAVWQYACPGTGLGLGFFEVPSDAAAPVADWIARVEARAKGWTIVKANDDEDDEADEGAVADDRSVTPVAAPTAPVVPDIVIEGTRLAWRDGDDWVVRMPKSASRAQLKAVNKALGATRFRRQREYVWLDGHYYNDEVRLQVAVTPRTEVAEPVAVAA